MEATFPIPYLKNTFPATDEVVQVWRLLVMIVWSAEQRHLKMRPTSKVFFLFAKGFANRFIDHSSGKILEAF